MSKTDFEKHFLSIYKTRWEGLYQALLADEKQKVMISEHEFKSKFQALVILMSTIKLRLKVKKLMPWTWLLWLWPINLKTLMVDCS